MLPAVALLTALRRTAKKLPAPANRHSGRIFSKSRLGRRMAGRHPVPTLLATFDICDGACMRPQRKGSIRLAEPPSRL